MWSTKLCPRLCVRAVENLHESSLRRCRSIDVCLQAEMHLFPGGFRVSDDTEILALNRLAPKFTERSVTEV